MIEEPSIVFLDEPSTGMDPVARWFMWEIISDIVTQKREMLAYFNNSQHGGVRGTLHTHWYHGGRGLTLLRVVPNTAQQVWSWLPDRIWYSDSLSCWCCSSDYNNILYSRTSSSLPSSTTPPLNIEPVVEEGQIENILMLLNRSHWKSRIVLGSSGAELHTTLQAHGWGIEQKEETIELHKSKEREQHRTKLCIGCVIECDRTK